MTAQLGHAHAERMIGVHMTLPVLPGVDRRDVPPEAFADDEQPQSLVDELRAFFHPLR